jgi:hypothetical protein
MLRAYPNAIARTFTTSFPRFVPSKASKKDHTRLRRDLIQNQVGANVLFGAENATD